MYPSPFRNGAEHRHAGYVIVIGDSEHRDAEFHRLIDHCSHVVIRAAGRSLTAVRLCVVVRIDLQRAAMEYRACHPISGRHFVTLLFVAEKPTLQRRFYLYLRRQPGDLGPALHQGAEAFLNAPGILMHGRMLCTVNEIGVARIGFA